MNRELLLKRIEELKKAAASVDDAGKTFGSLRQSAQAVREQTKELRSQLKMIYDPDLQAHGFQVAIDSVNRVLGSFEALTKNIEKESLSKRDIVREIGDYFGVKGGTYRDWEKFSEAAQAYSEGHAYEKRVRELGGPSNSYCLTQALVNLILSGEVKGDALTARLEEAFDEIKAQLNDDRKGDPWAQADLALVSELLDPEKAMDEWDALDDLKPKRNVYEAVSDVVSALFKKRAPELSEHDRASWQQLLDRLR